MRWKQYYYLAKPGIVYGNLLTTVAGYLLASRWHVIFGQFTGLVVGTSLIIAGACAFNNCLDSDMDRRMGRTQRRALVTGAITTRAALGFAALLTAAGFVILGRYNNGLVSLIGLIGFLDYVLAYSLSKRYTPWATIIGSLSGATPVVAGYCAVTGHFNIGALLLLLLLFFWQLAHFHAIALYREKDYRAARVPILPTTRAVSIIKLRIIAYVALFTFAALLLSILGYAGWVYGAVLISLGMYWSVVAVRHYRLTSSRWGQQVFQASLLVIAGVSLALAFGSVLP